MAKNGRAALKGIEEVIASGNCHRCGTCAGVCARAVFAIDDDCYPKIVDREACTDCSLCIKACSGLEFDLEQQSIQLFGKSFDIAAHSGHFKTAYLSHAADAETRARGTSGGFVTALLIDLIENKDLDGAIVVGADPDVPWKGKAELLKSADEIRRATKSKYAVTPVNAALAQIRETPGKYAVVGLPCHIHGIRKAMAHHKIFRERIALLIGLFCHSSIEPAAFRSLWADFGAERSRIKSFVYREGKHAGVPWLVFEDGSESPAFFRYAKSFQPDTARLLSLFYRVYSQKRCLVCLDATADFADIAVGDPWMPPPSPEINFKEGYTLVLARTARGEELMNKAENRGALVLLDLPSEKAKHSNIVMAQNKRQRAFAFMAIKEALRRRTPNYHIGRPRPSAGDMLKRIMKTVSYAPCWLPLGRRHILRLILSRPGYCLFWVNHVRRALTGKEKLLALACMAFELC